MANLLISEPVIMFLLGIGLVSFARFGRTFLKKHSQNEILISDRVKKLRLRDSLKLKLEIIQKKVERLIVESKKILSAKETADNINRDRRSGIERRQFSYKGNISEQSSDKEKRSGRDRR